MNENKPNLTVVNDVDDTLVDQAYEEIYLIFKTNAENAIDSAIHETGEYLIKTFYDNDLDKARKKESPKQESLNQLIKRLQSESIHSLSKSYIYNAVKLIIQRDDIETHCDKDVFHTYGKLTLSHKIVLLPVKKMDEKKELINKAHKDDLSVRELHQLKQERIPLKTGEATNTLNSLLNSPQKLFSDEFKKFRSLTAIKELTEKERRVIKSKVFKKEQKLEKEIDTLKKKIDEQKDSLKDYQKLASTIEKSLSNTAKDETDSKS